jgi:type I restriction enzyme S subunit
LFFSYFYSLYSQEEIEELQTKKIEALKLYKKGSIEYKIKYLCGITTSLKDVLKERKKYSEKGLEYPHVTLSKEGIYNKSERYNRDFLYNLRASIFLD